MQGQSVFIYCSFVLLQGRHPSLNLICSQKYNIFTTVARPRHRLFLIQAPVTPYLLHTVACYGYSVGTANGICAENYQSTEGSVT